MFELTPIILINLNRVSKNKIKYNINKINNKLK